MATFSLNHGLILFIVFATLYFFSYASSVDERKVYIVYMGSLPDEDYSPAAHHTTILEEILETSSVSDVLVTSYKRSFNGFAAKLTEVERQKLVSRAEVVSVFPSKTLQLQTSRSWDFMGLLETSERNHLVESDTIIGVIDTGIWPDSPSFTDVGFSPPPKKWKGVCAGGANFTCNNKVIGARYYSVGAESAIDTEGHGSHTASIAAGNIAKNTSFFGIGTSIARGGVPSARIAVYKVCGTLGCPDEAVLSAFDDAIADGVDIITISLGPERSDGVMEDAIGVGSFHAMMHNILTTQSAGNDGPDIASVNSMLPWLFSVGASSTDRRFVSKLVLGNKKEYLGSTVNSFSLKNKDYPLVFGKDAGKKCDESIIGDCDCLEPELVKGKIVICYGGDWAIGEAFVAGAAGVITTYHFTDSSVIVPFPAAMITKEHLQSVIAYYNSTKNPRANILKSEGLKIGSPPEVLLTSSRGPPSNNGDILKPDIVAPGVDILAAYSMDAPISPRFYHDSRRTRYSVLSGTSMACPHVAGAAAYVKTFHPDWSSSAIKSALMTTAWRMKNSNASMSIGPLRYEFSYGSGHIDPVKAVNPGLVYDATKEDYIKMLCDIGLTQEEIRKITGDKSVCPEEYGKSGSNLMKLNYPSMTASINYYTALSSVKFTRTVTNVGNPGSVYKSSVGVSYSVDETVKVVVEPNILRFKSQGEKKSFNVSVTSPSGEMKGEMFSANLVWSDGKHNVRSPIVVYY